MVGLEGLRTTVAGSKKLDRLVEHNLRTPVSLIVGYLSLLRDGDIPLEDALPKLEAAAQDLRLFLDVLLDR